MSKLSRRPSFAFVYILLAIAVMATGIPSFATSISSATFIKAVYNPSTNIEQIFYISEGDLNEYDVQTGTTTDLTTTYGLPAPAGPINAALYVPAAGATEIFYVDAARYLIQIIDTNGTYTFFYPPLSAQGNIQPWQAVSATNDPSTSTLELAFQMVTSGSETQYGYPGQVVAATYSYSTNSWSQQNLYQEVGRGAEHLETQVHNYYNQNYGQIQAGFDPQGEGHIHIISYIPGSSADKNEDLMDTTSSTGMNATDGGSGGGTYPVCQPSGFTSTYNTSLNTEELYYYGNDGYSHQILYNGSWHSLDFIKQAKALKAAGCMPFQAAYNPTTGYTEYLYYTNNSSSGSGLAISVLEGTGGSGWKVVGTYADSSDYTGNPVVGGGSMSVVYDTNTRNLDLFYMGYTSNPAVIQLFELSHEANGSYVLSQLT